MPAGTVVDETGIEGLRVGDEVVVLALRGANLQSWAVSLVRRGLADARRAWRRWYGGCANAGCIDSSVVRDCVEHRPGAGNQGCAGEDGEGNFVPSQSRGGGGRSGLGLGFFGGADGGVPRAGGEDRRDSQRSD